MPRPTPEQQIAKAEETIRRATKELREQERKKDTRRKIILGAALLDGAKTSENGAKYIASIIKKLERPTDIAAFEGFELPKPKASKPKVSS